LPLGLVNRLYRLAVVLFPVGKLVRRINAIPTETLERAAYLATIVGVPLLLVSLLVGYIQIHDVAKVARLQNSISLNTEFFNPTNTGIISAIEHEKPILVEHGGSFDDAQLDNYLGDFELIRSAFEQNLLTEDELCTSFSYFTTLTANDREVQKYIEEERKTDSGFYGGFTKIVKVVFRSKNENCH
jgi:hypothetical protein